MGNSQFHFDSETFNRIFPFYVLLDHNLLIQDRGKGLIKVLPDLKCGGYFLSSFTITNPFIEELNVDNFYKFTNQLVIIESVKDKISLRGQFENYENGYLFIGSLSHTSVNYFEEKKISLYDFAHYDAALQNSLNTIYQQENQLKEANKKIVDITLFTTQSPDPLIRIDFEGHILKMNPAAEHLKNLIFQGIDCEIEDFLKFIIHQIDKTKERWMFEAENNGKCYSFVCKSLQREGCVNIYGRDITEQKRDQEELNKLSLVAKTNKNGIVFTYPDGKIFWCNDAYLKLTGYENDEIIGKTPVEIGSNPLSNKEEIRRMINAFYEGNTFEVEILHAKKNGGTFWSKTVGQSILDSSKKVIQYFAMIEDISEDKQKEEQLLLLSSIADKNISAVIICDKEGKIEWANSSFTTMTGYSNEELIGKSPGRLLQGEATNSETIAYLKNQIRQGLPFTCEILNYTKFKKKYWVKVQGQALHNKQGEVIKYFAIEENISQEKEFNQQLIDSENRLTSLITNLQSGILLEDEDRKVLIANKRFCNLFDFKGEPEEMIGFDSKMATEENKHFFKRPDEFIERVEEILRDKKNVFSEEIELADGRVYERSFIPIAKGNKSDGHLWSFEDITIKKKYKESLEAEKEKYRNIIANMNMGLLEVDKNDIIQLANQSFCDMSGFSLIDLLGNKSSEILLHPEDKKLVTFKNNERVKGKSDSYEVTSINKKGETRYWLISGAPNYNVNGEVIGSIGIHLDITQQKSLELQKEELLKKLEKQNEQLNDYAQIVSHDLKSPLQSIHSLVTWIKEDNDKEFNAQTVQYLDMIEDKVEKMDHLIEGILTYSKVDDIEMITENINLNDEINKIINIIHIPKHIEIVVKNELPTIKAERFRMQQLFLNIISNAVNYIDKPLGVIEISFEEEKKHYIFAVKDNGPGIAEENQEKIFKIFQSFTSDKRSTGIGLSIVKKIVDNYNGKIWIESEFTKGTTFFIKVPK
ncbi:PAS domain S-box protein [Flavobacterium sp. Fl-318]|uniref:PAS domain S-box protein n=1 Tax=Flavobacterium cupriresistens TaxID=2893885 RepID=A0ABU4RHR0_9FLAO|nr:MULTISPECIES: PAS domain S-box protein [unclassified Flavobacterium]MDX6192107.1 PAS domain S-box protein [Flavobacterium sp. Fl-318]UFH44622.1 PAS domain S-box protein [Flavobacterium sp. F-323]